ncbi:Wall-associated kinase family protein [Rhynchospora pubera]|uniref:Wall-associated kinase family protein n=1 Tax=Rhynchospora pubera TaxID=906938 RepID=A0AAV8CR66_9POAL|nr:Wall-associated kinase family protein [Rhynchospora pubera]
MACVRQLQYFLFLILISPLPTAFAAVTLKNLLPGCPAKCGNITVPYPFGIGTGCFRKGFGVRCNVSTVPPRAFLIPYFSNQFHDVELMDINITSAEARAKNKNIAYTCFNGANKIGKMSLYTHEAFLFSFRQNKFVVIGCDTLAYILMDHQLYRSGCISNCKLINSTTGDGGSCNGFGCCQTAIPAGINAYFVDWGDNHTMGWWFNPCSSAMLVEDDWFEFHDRDLNGSDFYERNKNGVPVVLDWAIRDNGTCQDGVEKSPKAACLSNHSFCYNTRNGGGYLCQCRHGYEGNPYLPDGCIDIDECKSLDKYPCSANAICINTDGNFTCSCVKGTYGNPYVEDGNCIKRPEKFPYRLAIGLAIGLGVGTGFGAFLLYFAIRKHIKLLEKSKKEKMKQKFFNQNKGFLLQQRIASDEDATQRLRIYRLDELETATNRFDKAFILGQGGHGEVYKGILSDQRVVAIKKSKIAEQAEIDQFINEVVILSQVNHRNVVKLYGCCLETEVPLLVYEFISNGTLFDHLHAEPCSLTWAHRLRIALEAARAIAYLHSAASISVFHRDVKSTNILLDSYFTPKISDFGASRCVPLDQTGITTAIQGTFGYLDPEYYYTGRLTPKSDVYSFGVIRRW